MNKESKWISPEKDQVTFDESHNLRVKNLENWERACPDDFKHIDDNQVKLITADFLENQRILYQDGGFNFPFKIIKSVILKSIPNLLIHKLVSVQILPYTKSKIYGLRFEWKKDNAGRELYQFGLEHYSNKEARLSATLRFFSFEVVAKERKLPIQLHYDPVVLESEVDSMATKLKQYMDLDVLRDLWEYSIPTDKELTTANIHILITDLKRRIPYHDRSWVVVNQKTYDRHQDIFDQLSLHNLKLYVVDYWEQDGVLIGSYGESNYARDYFYCPHYFKPAPVVLDPETFFPKRSLLLKYSKKLYIEGAKSYRKILLKDE